MNTVILQLGSDASAEFVSRYDGMLIFNDGGITKYVFAIMLVFNLHGFNRNLL